MKPYIKTLSDYCISVLVLCMFLLATSCNKNILFTSNKPVSSSAGIASDRNETSKQEKVLMPDDKIIVDVWNHEDLSVGSLQATYSLAEEFGKWVMLDINGEVRLPQIGTVKLQGMTVHEATTFLEKAYSKFIQNPVINIRVLNNQVTVLGEVRSPGIYIFSSDHVRIADLIGKAQGFTDYAKTRKIKVVREANEMVVDLTNTSSVSAQQFTLYPGDVVYIPPTSGKAWERFSAKLIPVASLITAIALVYSVSNQSDN